VGLELNESGEIDKLEHVRLCFSFWSAFWKESSFCHPGRHCSCCVTRPSIKVAFESSDTDDTSGGDLIELPEAFLDQELRVVATQDGIHLPDWDRDSTY
jgi:hypothetical protein